MPLFLPAWACALVLAASACTGSPDPSPTLSTTAAPTIDAPTGPTISTVDSGSLTLLEQQGLHEIDTAMRGTLHAADGCLVMDVSTDGERHSVVVPEGTRYDEATGTIRLGDDSLQLDDAAQLLPATGYTAHSLEAAAPSECTGTRYVVLWALAPVDRSTADG